MGFSGAFVSLHLYSDMSQYLMAPIGLASFFENDNVARTNRETRCRTVQLKRST